MHSATIPQFVTAFEVVSNVDQPDSCNEGSDFSGQALSVVMLPDTAAEYRRRAEEHRKMAEHAREEGVAALLLAISADLEELADEIESAEANERTPRG